MHRISGVYKMISFESDYIEGCHPQILEQLTKTNLEQLSGYGNDKYSDRAKEKIAAACKCPGAQVHFICGGTQTNQLIIDALLQKYEGVVAVTTGHVSVHEAGAIEFTGHKVLTVPAHEGKMDSRELSAYLKTFYGDGNHEHMVQPGMVYISHPTEYGTLYTAAELQAIQAVCREYKLPLFVDGARLGYGLQAIGTDVDLPTLAQSCDVFYIGGTKVGALCGEAVVFTHGNTPAHFVTTIKQHGALLAKGRLLGIQFDTLFTDDLYFKISKHAIDMAQRLKNVFMAKGYEFFIDSPTNQQFVILLPDQYEKLSKAVKFSFWEALPDGRIVVRFATSWATPAQNIDELAKIL